MAEQETQLISKIITDDTRTPEVEGGGGERGRGESSKGQRHVTGMGMLYQNLQLLITAPWLPLTTTHHCMVDKRQTHRAILTHE